MQRLRAHQITARWSIINRGVRTMSMMSTEMFSLQVKSGLYQPLVMLQQNRSSAQGWVHMQLTSDLTQLCATAEIAPHHCRKVRSLAKKVLGSTRVRTRACGMQMAGCIFCNSGGSICMAQPWQGTKFLWLRMPLPNASSWLFTQCVARAVDQLGRVSCTAPV